MAAATELDAESLAEIARLVGESMPPELAKDPAPLTLTETFEVWRLIGVQGQHDIEHSSVAENVFHHQLVRSGRAVGFARSRRLPGADAWEVIQVFDSPFAALVEEAIAEVDKQVATDDRVRLLIVPEYHAAAFWLTGANLQRCYVIACPPTWRAFQSGRLMDATAFLEILQSEVPIVGILPDAGPRAK
jgi:hypothetical protein